MGLWWTCLFLLMSLAEGLALPRDESLMRGTDKCLYFPGGSFQCPVEMPIELKGRWEREMKVITRSQLRRVIGKVCSDGSL